MKGIVFTEFLDYVADCFGRDMVDDLLDDCDFSHCGAYTAVETYDHRELVQLILSLSRQAGLPAPTILRDFGVHLSQTFARRFPFFFEERTTLFDFLDSVENTIHVEVLKLYPDAELPRFITNRRDDSVMSLDYHSSRCFSGLAAGLIEGAARYYDTAIELTQATVSQGNATHVRFDITLR